MQNKKKGKKNVGQLPLTGIEPQLEAEAAKKDKPIGMPPLSEVRAEVQRLGLPETDAEHLYDSWLASGFRLRSGVKVRDWKAVIRIWHRNNYFRSQKQVPNDPVDKHLEARRDAIRRMRQK